MHGLLKFTAIRVMQVTPKTLTLSPQHFWEAAPQPSALSTTAHRPPTTGQRSIPHKTLRETVNLLGKFRIQKV